MPEHEVEGDQYDRINKTRIPLELVSSHTARKTLKDHIRMPQGFWVGFGWRCGGTIVRLVATP